MSDGSAAAGAEPSASVLVPRCCQWCPKPSAAMVTTNPTEQSSIASGYSSGDGVHVALGIAAALVFGCMTQTGAGASSRDASPSRWMSPADSITPADSEFPRASIFAEERSHHGRNAPSSPARSTRMTATVLTVATDPDRVAPSSSSSARTLQAAGTGIPATVLQHANTRPSHQTSQPLLPPPICMGDISSPSM